MKTIGLIGGMSWESSLEYYKTINKLVNQKLGGMHSAKILMYSVDFDEIEYFQRTNNWLASEKILTQAAIALERGGADFFRICTNTMHKIADEVARGVNIPLLHIADPTAERIKTNGFKKVGLLGTKYTMEEAFYKGRLVEKFNLEVIIPVSEEREIVHHIIYDELCLGKILNTSRDQYRKIISSLIYKGAEGVILGCTEIPLLVSQDDSSVPLFDTTFIHAETAVEYALSDDK